MDALVMCGGRGSRLDAEREKPLVEVGGVPMVDRVLDALAASRVADVSAVVSPHAPETRDYLDARGVACIDAPGDGYVPDLRYAIDRIDGGVLTVAADLPLLASDPIDRALSAADGALTVVVPAELKRRLGASVETTVERDGRALAPTGLNVVSDTDDTMYVSYDARVAVNVNRPADLTLAEALCA